MQYTLMVLLTCSGVLAAPPVFVVQPLVITGDGLLQRGMHVVLASPGQGQLLVTPGQKSKGVEDYDEGVEDSKDWKEEDKGEKKEDYDNGQYDPKKYEETEDYNETSETEKSEITQDYNEKSENEGKYEQTEEYNEKIDETTTVSEVETTSNVEREDESGKYYSSKYEEQSEESGSYEEKGEHSGKYEPDKNEEQSNDSGKYDEQSEQSGKYEPGKYEEKDDNSQNDEWGKYKHDDSGKYIPGKYEENSLDGFAASGQNTEQGNPENRSGKSSQVGENLKNNVSEQKSTSEDEHQQKTKDVETKRETVEGVVDRSDKESSSKSVHVPEEIVVGSIHKSPTEKTEDKSETESVPGVVKVTPPLKETEVVQLAPVVYHVSPKLIPAAPVQQPA